MRSSSLSNFFDSDNERLNPILSLSKKFDSDNEFLIYMTNVIKYICLFYMTPVCMYVCRACLHSFFIDRQAEGELRITRIPRDAVI